MRFWSICANLCAPIFVTALLYSTSTGAATLESVQEKIDIAVSPDKSAEARVEAANSMTEGWPDSVPVLMQNIDAYYQSSEGRPYSEDAAAKLVPLTDLLVTIVVNKDGSAQKFRETDTDKTVDLLAWAARGDDRDLRFNSSYILAKVVDNSNLCIILHHLRDPSIGYSGRINLLQIAIPAASNAYRENVEATKETVDKLRDRVEGKDAMLLNFLDQNAAASKNANQPLPSESYCAQYDIETGLTASPAVTP